MNNKSLIWVSDPHFDHLTNDDVVEEAIVSVNERFQYYDGLIITGDISNGNSLHHHLERLKNDYDKNIYFVLGNHDFYHSSFERVYAILDNSFNNYSSFYFLDHNKRLFFLEFKQEVFKDLSTAIIGVTGWNDFLYGKSNSKFHISDMEFIEELKPSLYNRDLQIELCRERSKYYKNILKEQLNNIPENINNIIIVTHVPPYDDASYHLGDKGSPESLPFFTSGYTGVIIDEFAEGNKDKNIIVLCGHTHSPSIYTKDNIHVFTGFSEYGKTILSGEVFISKKEVVVKAFNSRYKYVSTKVLNNG